MRSTPNLAFNALLKYEDGLWVAHCMELDIVATGDSPDSAVNDLKDLIVAQVSCALANDNTKYLYHSAPKEVWDEYWKAEDMNQTPRGTVNAASGVSFFKTIFANGFGGTICHA